MKTLIGILLFLMLSVSSAFAGNTEVLFQKNASTNQGEVTTIQIKEICLGNILYYITNTGHLTPKYSTNLSSDLLIRCR